VWKEVENGKADNARMIKVKRESRTEGKKRRREERRF